MDRHAQVTTNVKMVTEQQLFQATERTNQPPRCKIAQKAMLSSQNINLPNINKIMITRWLGWFPITQVKYQHNNYTLDLSSNFYHRHIHNTFHIGLLKPAREHNENEFLHRDHRESGPVKNDLDKVENVVNFRCRYSSRESLYQSRLNGNLSSQDQWIHGDEIDEKVKFRFWQEEGLKPTFQRRRCHRDHPGPRMRSERLAEIQVERDRVMQCIIRPASRPVLEFVYERLSDNLGLESCRKT